MGFKKGKLVRINADAIAGKADVNVADESNIIGITTTKSSRDNGKTMVTILEGDKLIKSTYLKTEFLDKADPASNDVEELLVAHYDYLEQKNLLKFIH